MYKIKSVNILLIEDDKELALNLLETLELYCQKVYWASTTLKAKELLDTKEIHLIFSDIHLAKENGLDFLETLESLNIKIPLVIISGFDKKEYLLKAIKLNVVDYLVKPISLEVLESTLMKCDNIIQKASNLKYELKDGMIFDITKKILYKNNKELPLTAREFAFLKLCVEFPDHIITKEMIENYVFENETMGEAAYKNLIFRLRKKLGNDFIKTIPNMGYKINHIL
jgi:two-component system response regulator VanR